MTTSPEAIAAQPELFEPNVVEIVDRLRVRRRELAAAKAEYDQTFAAMQQQETRVRQLQHIVNEIVDELDRALAGEPTAVTPEPVAEPTSTPAMDRLAESLLDGEERDETGVSPARERGVQQFGGVSVMTSGDEGPEA